MYYFIFHPAIFKENIKKYYISRTNTPIQMIFSLKFIINQAETEIKKFSLKILDLLCESALNCLKANIWKCDFCVFSNFAPNFHKVFDMLGLWNLAYL